MLGRNVVRADQSTHVQIRYTCCSILICFSRRDCAFSFRSSSMYGGSEGSLGSPSSCPGSGREVGLRDETFTFQNYLSLSRVNARKPTRRARLTHLIDHVAFRMPTLVSHVPVNLHELFEDRTIATRAFRRVSSRVVEVTVYISLVLVVRVLRAEEGGAH